MVISTLVRLSQLQALHHNAIICSHTIEQLFVHVA